MANKFSEILKERLGASELDYEIGEHANTIPYSLGGMTLASLGLLILTGMLLAQFYIPGPESANQSLHYLSDQVFLGWYLRGVHFWAAEVLTVTLILHMMRVFWTASYKKPREVNWLVGVVLLLLMVGLLFTGTVIKWDQEAYEALAHFTWVGEKLGILGLPLTERFAEGVPMVSRVYMWHISLLPIVTLPVLGLHLFYIRHHKLSPLPESPAGGRTIRFTDHLLYLQKAGAGVVTLICLLALVIAPPLGQAPVHGLEVTKPPWQFVWIYALENLWVPSLIVAPLILVLGLVLVPFVDRSDKRHWRDRPVAVAVLALTLLLMGGLIIWGKVTTMTHSM